VVDETEAEKAGAREKTEPFAREQEMEKRSKNNKDNKGIHEPEGVVVFIKEDAFEDVGQGGSKGFATRNKIREWGVSVGDCKEETDNIPDEVGNKEGFDAASEFSFVE
jgi:hypothetical protein